MISDVKNAKMHVTGLNNVVPLRPRPRVPPNPAKLIQTAPETEVSKPVLSTTVAPIKSLPHLEQQVIRSSLPEAAQHGSNHIPDVARAETDGNVIPASLQDTLKKHFNEEQIKDLWEWAANLPPPAKPIQSTPSARGLAKFKKVQLLQWSQGTHLPERTKFMPEEGHILRKIEFFESKVIYHKLIGDDKRAQEFRELSRKLQIELVNNINAIRKTNLDVKDFPTLEHDLKDWTPANVIGDGGLFKRVIEWDSKVAVYLYNLPVNRKGPKATAKAIENWAYERSKHLL